ncbi:hypothetical protein HMPREF9123_1734 [Neisseria bacilliformis ATCC BAA-1200]|uniref:Uncharacterized protein n=1 Tax=Neisseria bacilliformis ATCC BAA-1200 TaxID=888742 RepID=F2BDC8_9NEIS|nr:hypothetical protein HMPREF9123_1734 [Neisseria bacilliformis ATCC BAA-1200]
MAQDFAVGGVDGEGAVLGVRVGGEQGGAGERHGVGAFCAALFVEVLHQVFVVAAFAKQLAVAAAFCGVVGGLSVGGKADNNGFFFGVGGVGVGSFFAADGDADGCAEAEMAAEATDAEVDGRAGTGGEGGGGEGEKDGFFHVFDPCGWKCGQYSGNGGAGDGKGFAFLFAALGTAVFLSEEAV